MASYISNLLGSGGKSSSWFPNSSNSGSLTDTVKNVVSKANPLASASTPSSLLDKAKSLVPGLSPAGSKGFVGAILGTKDDTFFTKMYENAGMSSTLATVLGYVSYILYQQFINKDPRTALQFMKSHLGQTLSLIPGASKIPGVSSLLAGGLKGANPSVAAKNALASIRKNRPSLLSKLNPFNWDMFNKKKIKENKDDEAYQAGEPYADPEVVSTGLADDLKAIGLKGAPKDLEVLINLVKNKGKPLDDRQMDVEKLIALAASLPTNSKARKKLTGVLIDTLWSSLQHPPMSYLGDKYQYRSADGSNNNPLFPNLGKSGSAYAKTVKKVKHLKGCQPDPGMLFDFLMARSDTSFKENPAGISSMLFYHATIIIHDIFCSNRFDHNISDTSSYLDLAPLYGSNLEDQLKIRTMQNGLLKPDTFSEKRLLGQPPGVNVVLVMYSRFHNYCAETLLKINEYDRFSLPKNISSDEQQKQALAKQDEDLFQTARLIVNGLYVNICLYDYLRGLTNTHHSASDWTLDPRVEVDRLFDAEGVPRGSGNQISAEFNLLYRFHSTISLRDEKWLNEFMGTLFPNINKPFDQLTPQEFIQGLFRYEQSIPKEPEKREFAGLQRGPDGKFNDADLVKIMKESCEDPAGLFGPRMVPKALKMVEIAGILSARKWQLASLNEMRDFFGLKRHAAFEEVNPDPEIADLLRKFYQHPDMIEMYPGLFIEDGKPRMDPGCGGCPPYTVGRAVFSDAVSLVRSDRFLTLDYSPSTLTNWGIEEVKYDLRVMGGSMYYKLFHRALPNWFPYNSLHIMQPMFTRKMNEEIAKEIGTIDQYTMDDPKPPKRPVIVANAGMIQKILSDQDNFKVTWGKPFADLFPGKKDYSGYMLAGDKKENTAQRNLVGGIMYASPDITRLISDTTLQIGEQLLKRNTFVISNSLNQVDIVRDVAIPANTRILSELFCLDLKTEDNPNGSLTTNQMFKYLSDVRCWGFENTDVAMAWKRRMWAQEGAKALEASTKKSVAKALSSAALGSPTGIVSGTINTTKSVLGRIPVVGGLLGGQSGKSASTGTPANATLKWLGANIVKELAAAGQTPDQIADVSWLNAVGGIGVIVGLFASILEYFLKPENAELWAKVQTLATTGSSEAINKALRPYILEAQRLTSNQQDLRFCIGGVTIDGQQFKPGDAVLTLLGLSGRNPASVPDPGQFKLDRPAEAYLHYGWGPHKCLGREVGIAYAAGMLRLVATTKGLRQAPDKMGQLKVVMMGPGNQEKLYMNDSWSYLTKDPTTWTLHFEGYGKGVYDHPTVDVADGRDLKTIFAALKQQAKDEPKGTSDSSKNANGMPVPPIDPTSDQAKATINAPSQAPPVTAQTNGANSTPQHNGESESNGTKQANGSTFVEKVTNDVKSGVHDAANGVDQVKNKLIGDLKKDSPMDEAALSNSNTADKPTQNVTDGDASPPTNTSTASKPVTSVSSKEENGVVDQAPIDASASKNTNTTAETIDKTPTTEDADKANTKPATATAIDTSSTTLPEPGATPSTDKGDSDVQARPTQSDTALEKPAAVSEPSAPSVSDKPADATTSSTINGVIPTVAGTTPATPAPPVVTAADSFAAQALNWRSPSFSSNSATNTTTSTTTTTSNIGRSPAVTSTSVPFGPSALFQDRFGSTKPVPAKVQQGNFSRAGDYTRGIGIQSFEQTVTFSRPYDKPPRVALSTKKMDISASGSPVNFFQSATNVTPTGFTWSVSVGGTRHWLLESNWIAIPDNEDYADVTVAVFDSRKEGNKVIASNKFTHTLDINSLHGSVYNRAPTVVTWLTGFEIKATNKQIPGNIKIRCNKGDNVTGSSVDVAVQCSDIEFVPAVQMNVILIPDSSNMTSFYHNTYDTTPNLPFIGSPQSRTATFFPRAFLRMKRIQNTIGLAGFDFSKTGSSIRYESSIAEGIGSYVATVGTWYDGLPNSITAWVVSSEQ